MIDKMILSNGNTTGGHAVLRRIISRSEDDGSLATLIAEAIGSAIIEGHLKPGDDLNTVDLSTHFKSSRTPVREALMLLEKQGLVDICPRRRPRVAQLSLAQVRELYEVRANLYGLVAELIVARSSDEEICSLEPHLGQMAAAVRAGDLDAYFWANIAFQDVETTICGNSFAKRTLESLMLPLLRWRYLRYFATGGIERSLADHNLLLRAYKDRDAALAIALKRGPALRRLAAIERDGWKGLIPEDVPLSSSGSTVPLVQREEVTK